MSDEAVREEFELAALRLNWSQELYSLERMEHGGYLDNYLEMRWQAWQAARSDAGEKLRLLKRAVNLFASYADYNCGEGTPCDDMRPRYVCPEHRWLKEARAAIRKLKRVTNGERKEE